MKKTILMLNNFLTDDDIKKVLCKKFKQEFRNKIKKELD